MKVLAVDDSPVICNMIRDILSSEGHEVETAENAFQGLDIYSRLKPDLVTLDILMPTMDGLKALTNILSIDKSANVVMLSASEDNPLTLKCLKKGAIGYITKPFTAEELIYSVNNFKKIKENKFYIKIFSDVTKIMNQAIKNILNEEAEVILDRVQIEEKEATVDQSADLSKIRKVPEKRSALNYSIPEGCCGYITKLEEGKKIAMLSIVNPHDFDKEKDDEEMTEFFNIINSKIVSSYANVTDTELVPHPTKLYEESDQISDAEYVVKGKMEIRLSEKSIPLETQIWFGINDN